MNDKLLRLRNLISKHESLVRESERIALCHQQHLNGLMEALEIVEDELKKEESKPNG